MNIALWVTFYFQMAGRARATLPEDDNKSVNGFDWTPSRTRYMLVVLHIYICIYTSFCYLYTSIYRYKEVSTQLYLPSYYGGSMICVYLTTTKSAKPFFKQKKNICKNIFKKNLSENLSIVRLRYVVHIGIQRVPHEHNKC